MAIDLLLVITTLAALAAASYADIKSREVPDWISYGLIIAAFAFRFIESLATGIWSILGYGLLGFAITFLFGNVMFRARQWGGGDAKLIMGVGTAFATRPSFLPHDDLPFLLIVVTNILMIGAIYGIIYGIMLAIKNWKKFIAYAAEANKQSKTIKKKLLVLVIALAILFIILTVSLDIQQKLMIGILALLMLLYPYLTILVTGVEKVCLLKQIPVNKLTPGDWVEQDVHKNNKLIYKRKPLGIELEDIQVLMKAKIKSVLVKEGIPFIPPFFLGALFSVLTGKIMGLI